MQHMYVDVPAHATANLIHLSEKLSLLSGIEVLSRNRNAGHGAKLLNTVLADADQEQVTLILLVEPDGSTGALNDSQLFAWYGKHGFTIHPQDPHAMRREPQTTL